jgi:ketosteroid isomerase-like protein
MAKILVILLILPKTINNLELKTFEPREFIHSGNDVIAHIHLEYKVKKTDKDVSMDQLHWWTLNLEGKVARLVTFEDTGQVIAAFSG